MLIGFSGRADRGDFWKAQLVVVLLSVPFALTIEGPFADRSIWAVLFRQLAVMSMLMAGALWVSIEVRRFHDLGKSGWLFWGNLIPLLNICLWMYLGIAKGQSFGNRHGPKPNAWWHRTKHWKGGPY